MPTQRGRSRTPEPEAEEQVPPFYVATAPLPYGPRGAFPTYAYQAGDRVPPADVGPNGWGDRVEVPEQFKGQLAPPPQPEPEPDKPAEE